ncbi:MAG: hypothetical protein H7067_09280 [Burkholderiales bacterium]|nr:hypothetical protein [Opitutaceae bacterium]
MARASARRSAVALPSRHISCACQAPRHPPSLRPDFVVLMRRLSALLVLCAWLLASGAHWDLVQSFAWARMVATYSRTMPLDEAVRLAFTADNLCGVCEFVADAKTRADLDNPSAPVEAASPTAAADSAAKGKLLLAHAPEHLFVFCTVPAPEWPTEQFLANAHARPAPPTEPPRAA